MRANFRIRNARYGDIDAISTVHAQCWQSSYQYLPKIVLRNRNEAYRRRQWTQWFEHPPCHFSRLYVVECRGSVCGFSFCCENKDESIRSARGELHAAYLLPGYRGGIVGANLLLTMMNGLDDAGLLPASIWTWQRNPLRVTYGALGFVPLVRRNRIIAGQPIPEIGYISPPLAELTERLNRAIAAYGARSRYQIERYYRRQQLPCFASGPPD